MLTGGPTAKPSTEGPQKVSVGGPADEAAGPPPPPPARTPQSAIVNGAWSPQLRGDPAQMARAWRSALRLARLAAFWQWAALPPGVWRGRRSASVLLGGTLRAATFALLRRAPPPRGPRRTPQRFLRFGEPPC